MMSVLLAVRAASREEHKVYEQIERERGHGQRPTAGKERDRGWLGVETGDDAPPIAP
jgi:hypothetical protein